ncbi:MAG: Integrase, partial [Frankiales bacterium]|nr:Integrase [Frankiales bacterium]
LARLGVRRVQAHRQARPPARLRQDTRARRREGPRARAQARLRNHHRDVDPHRRRLARALAREHRPTSSPAANGRELRVQRPPAPDPGHRPAPARPPAARAPRPALHAVAGRRLLPRHRAARPPDPVRALTVAMQRGHIARNVATLVDPPQQQQSDLATALDVEEARAVLEARGTSATPPAGPSPSPWACASPRRSRCSGRTSTCSPTRSRCDGASTASAAVA